MDGFDKLLLESEIPLVAVLLDVRYHPVVFSNVTDVKLSHSEKALYPMYVTPFPMVMDVKPVQSEKA